MFTINLKPIVAALVALVMYSLPLQAEADIDALFDRLSRADSLEAQKIDREIHLIWEKSGSATMNLLLQRGRDALERGEIEAALDHLSALTDHAPNFADGWHTRAQAYFHAGYYGPALADLERTLALNPREYDAIFGLARILEELGRFPEAYDAYMQVAALHPHHKDLAEAFARLETRVNGVKL